MSRIKPKVMLVGSVPLTTAEEVFAATADEIGHLVAALPDGETGYRTSWVNFQAYLVHHPHPDLETLVRPPAVDGVLQWNPSGLRELWNFKVKDGVESVTYGDLYYAEAAIRSYVAFGDLRKEGRIPDGVRFQVSLPTPHGGVSGFFRANPDDYYRVYDGYRDAMTREVRKIVDAIPRQDLAIQWDTCTEVADNEGAFRWLPQDHSAWSRFEQVIDDVGSVIPDEVLLGYHLCYGNLGGKHIVEPTDLGLLTRMANAAVAGTRRRVDWIQMPVPISRDDDDDDEYFAPLADLHAPDSVLVLGLVHQSDGVAGARKRLDAARKRAPCDIAVSTECGFGRLSADAVRPLLTLHREIAEQLL